MAEAEKTALLNRLKTIRGHISGIEKMIKEEKDCADILVQITAVTSSMIKVKSMVIKHLVDQCIDRAMAEENDLKKEMTKLLDNVLKYNH
jgi:DNA-binding FrmR family transcriptional regulator